MQTAVARQGADVEVPSTGHVAGLPEGVPEGVPRMQLDQQTLQQAGEAVPDWDVHPEELVRTGTGPAGAAALRALLEQVAAAAGRLRMITVSGDQVTVRLRVAGGPQPALLELATALNAVFSGSQAPGADPQAR